MPETDAEREARQAQMRAKIMREKLAFESPEAQRKREAYAKQCDAERRQRLSAAGQEAERQKWLAAEAERMKERARQREIEASAAAYAEELRRNG